MTVAVDATETTMQELLEGVQRGDTVQLQKDGRIVAIVSPAPFASQPPVRSPEQVAQARAALARMDERRKRLGLRFDFNEFKADKEFGRR